MLYARKRRKLSLITSLVTLLTVLVIPTGGASAADIGPIDCVSPTLQSAIDSAFSGDTIIITDGSNCTGNFDVNKPLTIRAETATGATLDGDAVDGAPVVFVSTGGSVTLQDLTITGGLNTVPGAGGGVLTNTASLTLTDVTITGNDADVGAGLYIGGGTVTVSGGSIDDNSASTNGGGVWNNGTVTFSGAAIGSALNPNTADDGGGIYNTGTLTLSASSVVDSNTAANATGGGGGIWNDGTLTITDSTVSDNTAVNGGGGIHNISGGTVTATNATISGNSAEHAGGILNNGAGNTGSTVTLTNSTVSANAATGSDGEPAGGGGIYNFSFPADTVKADLTLSGTDVTNNTSAEGGAGIRNADSAATITGGTIDLNVATGLGGGIRTSGTMTVTDATISQNSATVSGGGIALDGDGSTLAIVTTAIDDNDAVVEGGGLSVAPNTSASVTQSSVTRNDSAAGGGISNAGVASVVNSTVSTNTATTQGAGIKTEGNLTVNHATIADNNTTGEGGGIRVIGVPTVTLTGTILFGNTAGSGGPDCSGPLASGGYSLVGNKGAPCVLTADPTDLPALSDPMLGPLTAGSPEYHPLMAGSDAIDAAATDCGLTVDQNGDVRPDGPACDVGAVEATSPVMADEVLLVEPNGKWHIQRDGMEDYTFFYGVPGDIPIFGDWDGDGLDTPGAYRVGPGGGFAYMTNTLPPNGGAGIADFNFYFGDPSLGDEVLVGDWDGDGTDTIGVNRNGRIFLTDTNASGGAPAPTDYDFFFGVPGDVAFGGDPDGDGKDSVFLYRGEGPGAGFVYYTNETPVGPAAVAATADNFFFGIASDLFVAGDWDRDGVDTAGIFRPSNTTVYLTNTNASGGAPAPTDDSYVFGSAAWVPVAGVSGVS